MTKHKLSYKNQDINLELDLCENCLTSINYSFDKLLICPHEEKPRCRVCPNPCYEKDKWKALSKIMRYSGAKLGLTKLKNKIKEKFKKIIY